MTKNFSYQEIFKIYDDKIEFEKVYPFEGELISFNNKKFLFVKDRSLQKFSKLAFYNISHYLRSTHLSKLKKTSEYGISNGHHFYITFDTTNPKNQIPEYLKKDYPKTMMIVIENEFWNLKVEQEYFSVDLKFKGKIDHLKINFSSLKTFVDPSVSFTLNLDIEDKIISKKSKDKNKVLKKKQLENKSNVIFLKPKSS